MDRGSVIRGTGSQKHGGIHAGHGTIIHVFIADFEFQQIGSPNLRRIVLNGVRRAHGCIILQTPFQTAQRAVQGFLPDFRSREHGVLHKGPWTR